MTDSTYVLTREQLEDLVTYAYLNEPWVDALHNKAVLATIVQCWIHAHCDPRPAVPRTP